MPEKLAKGIESEVAIPQREFVKWDNKDVEYIPDYKYDARYKILVQPYNWVGPIHEVLADVKEVDGNVEIVFDLTGKPKGVSEQELRASIIRHLINPEKFAHFSEQQDEKGDADYQFSIDKEPIMRAKPGDISYMSNGREMGRNEHPWIV